MEYNSLLQRGFIFLIIVSEGEKGALISKVMIENDFTSLNSITKFDAKYLKEELKIFDVLDCNCSIITFGDTSLEVSFYSPFESCRQTLINIEHLLVSKNFSNAYVLVRKLRDDVIQYLFLLRYASYKNFRKFKINMANNEHLCVTYRKQNVTVDELNTILGQWLTNKLENTSVNRRIFSCESYYKWLTLDPLIKELLDTYFADSSKKINTLLNSYVHANGVNYIYDNYCNCRNFDRIDTKIEELKEVVVYITCLCLSLICLIQSNLLRTSDYEDALECNTQTIEDSQYWVIGFVNLYMLKNFPSINEDLYDFVTRNNINGMKFNSGVID